MRVLVLLVALHLTGFAAVIGFVDIANCSTIEGWAADTARLNQSVAVTLGAREVTANLSRPDVGKAIGDNGLHGFRIAGPHYNGTYTVKSGAVTLSGGTFTLANCGNPPAPPPPPPTSDYWTFKAGDKLDISGGLMATAINGRIQIMVDGTSVPLFEDPAKLPCRDGSFGRRGPDLLFCAGGSWSKVQLVKP